jgi:hypothetical protein
MSRSLSPLTLLLGPLALAGCGGDSGPTQPEGAGVPAEATALAAFTPNTWTLKAAPPNFLFVNQASAGAFPDAVGNSVVYLLGGRDDDGGSGASVATYRININKWSVPSFEPRLYVFNTNGVGRVGKLLYVSGGESFSGGFFTIDRSLWAYDPAVNTLTSKAPAPIPVAEGVTGVIGASLYVLPGAADTSTVPPIGYLDYDFRGLYRYNTTTDVWSSKRPSPHLHRQAAGGVIDGKLYVAGGRGNVADLDRYDPATNTWTTLAPLPAGGPARGAVILGKLLAVVEVGGDTHDLRAFLFDPATGKWTRKAAPHWDHPAYVPITWAGKQFLLGIGGIHCCPFGTNPTEVYAP